MSWEKVEIGNLVTLRQGLAINKQTNHYVSEDPTSLPLLRIGDMKNGEFSIFIKEAIPEKFIAKCHDIIYTRTGQVGLVFRRQHGVVHNNCFTVNSNNENLLNQDFLYYALKEKSFYEEALSRATGAAQPDLPHDAFKTIRFFLPPIETQKKIADILSAYDDLIENNQKQIKLLEEAAQRLYKEWFVDLRFPGYETTPILDGIPQGWKKEKINDVFDIKYGKNLPTSQITEQGKYPVYGANGVIGYYDKCNSVDYITLVTSRGNGSGDVSRTHHKRSFITNNSFIIVPKERFQYCELPFTYLLFLNLDFKAICTGSAQPQLTNTSINTLKIIVPNKELISSFIKITKEIFEKIEILYKHIAFAKEARDRLLPKLMSGEIEV